MARNPDIVVTTLDSVGYPILLRMNQLQPPFNSAELRRAVLGAVDQAMFLQAAVGSDDYTTVCKSFLPCGTPFSIGSGSGIMTGDLETARKAVRASGYDGTKAVILAPSDNPVVSGCCAVADALFKQIGINSDLTVMDVATMIGRRTSMEPVANGGWSVFVSYGESAQFSNPATHIALRADGKAAWPGWPTDPALQALCQSYLTASTEVARRDLASRIEQQAFVSIPYIPLGQFRQPTIYRRHLRGSDPGYPTVLERAEGMMDPMNASRHGTAATMEIGDLELELGGVLRAAELAYVAYGSLAGDGRNAVLLTHGYTSSHLFAEGGTSASEGSWSDLVGAGKPIDTSRYFVVSSNVLGSSFGSTAPMSLNPATGRPYGLDFPPLTLRDMVTAQRRLLDRLGVEKLLAVGGTGSLQTRDGTPATSTELIE